jgi:predicted GNAT superfamily acetyltransferase
MTAVTAQRDARAASAVAGVRIRELAALDDLAAVCRLFDAIWQPEPAERPATADLLRALTKAGNYVAGAYDGGTLVGACMAFFGPPRERTLHSHITGVAAAGRSVGYALKLHQRAWALDRGATTISWTYDPLIGRNAHFNVVKLGARPVEYLPDFYGAMRDGINAGDESDRLLVRWDLAAAVGTPAGAPPDADVALGRSADGRPVAGSVHGDTVLVAVPPDVERLRRADPQAARQWRMAVREALRPLLAADFRVTGFDRERGYVLSRRATVAATA